MRHHRLTRSAALGLALVALAAPTAAAQSQNLRSPDAHDAAVAAQVRQDLRSPDTRDAAVAAQVRQDLRSPDARDATEGRTTFSAPEVTVVKLQQPSPSAAGGLDWGDAGIGAGTLLLLILLGSTLAVLHRRHGAPARRETATTG
jgi:hypothetical protein